MNKGHQDMRNTDFTKGVVYPFAKISSLFSTLVCGKTAYYIEERFSLFY